jgi:hypothetical protein
MHIARRVQGESEPVGGTIRVGSCQLRGLEIPEVLDQPLSQRRDRRIIPTGKWCDEIVRFEADISLEHLNQISFCTGIAVAYTHKCRDGITRHNVDQHEDEEGNQQENQKQLDQVAEAVGEHPIALRYPSTTRFRLSPH